MISRGFVYVATGTGYLEEARISAESLRRHHPDIPICLVTDRPLDIRAPFDHVIQRGDVEHKPIDKLLAWHCPFDRAVFLDTDTRVGGDLTTLFDVVEHFDLAALQDVNRGWDYPLDGVPECFTEFNTGVIAFRRTPKVAQFFASWRAGYDALQVKQGHLNRQSDQPAFRQALYHSDLRIAPLPSEFHFIANFPNATLWKVRLLHGRGDLDRIAEQVDQELGGRVFIPNVGVVSAFRGRRHWFATTLRVTWRMARLCLFPPTDNSAKTPRYWWLDQDDAAQKPDKSP